MSYRQLGLELTRLAVSSGGQEEAGAELGQAHHHQGDQILSTAILPGILLQQDRTPQDVLQVGDMFPYVASALIKTITDILQCVKSLVELLNTFGNFPCCTLRNAQREKFVLREVEEVLV